MTSFRILELVLLVIASSKSIVAVDGDNSGGTHVTIQIQNAAELTFNKPKDFKVDFEEFENKTKSYIQSAKKANEARSSDSLRFLTELNQYIAKLPKGKSTTIKFRGRLACDCDGKRMNPCPAQCMYSCFGLFESGKGWISENDCRNKQFLECQCYRGSLEMCNSGITSCFKETTGELPGDEVCSTYSVDEDKLVQSYVLVEDLLVEPINVFIRKLRSSLGSMGQTAESIEHLSSLKWSACNPNVDQKCSEGPAALLRNQIESYQLLKMNLTSEMIVTLKETININKDVIGLRERIFTHVNGLLKGYACCLRASNHNTEKIDCSPAQQLPSTDWYLLVPNRTEPQKPKELPVYGSYKWVPSNGSSFPENAVRAGTELNETPLYAGRVLIEGMLLPAKVTSKGRCYLPNDGKEFYTESNFQILVSKDVYWEPMNSDMPIPPDALIVGFDKKSDPIYMGRAVLFDHNVPGQVKSSDRCAYVPFNGEERRFCKYEIMVLRKIK